MIGTAILISALNTLMATESLEKLYNVLGAH